jgi:hypothetical protein
MLDLHIARSGIAQDSAVAALPINNESNFSTNTSILTSNVVESIKTLFSTVVHGFETVIEPIQKVLVFQHILQIYKIPYTIVDIVKNRNFISEKDPEKRIDKGLKVCNNFREISETTGAFIVALDTLKAISFPVSACAKPFTAVISILSIGAMITKYRTCMKVFKFMRALNDAEEKGKVDGRVTLQSYQGIMDLIAQKQAEDDQFIGEMFNTTEEKLGDVLSRIQVHAHTQLSTGEAKEVDEGQKIIETASSALKGRVKKEFISHTVALVASIIALIGTLILLVTPSTVIGWIMLGLGILIDIEQFIYHKVTEYQFATAVDLKRTKWEWITC